MAFLHLSTNEYRELMAKSHQGKCRNKYGNCKSGSNDSKIEARYGQSLELLRHHPDDAQRVLAIERKKKYRLIEPNGKERGVNYEADYCVTYADGRVEVVDVKSNITKKNRAYVIKRKLMLERFGISIIEVTAV